MCLESIHFFQPAAVAFLRSEARLQEGANEFQRQFPTNHPGTQHQHVYIVVLNTLVGRIGVVAEARANPR